MINQRTSTPDWANRWVGGFCAPGMYGGPIRAADYRTPVTLTQSLPLPAHLTESHAPSRTSLAPGLLPTLWSQLVGEAAVVLVKNVRQARALLLDGLTRTPPATVTLPANASHALVETVKRQRLQPVFAPLGDGLQLIPATPGGLVWQEALAGQPVYDQGDQVVLDYADSVPLGAAPPTSATAILYGLHLSTSTEQAGALLVLPTAALARQVRAAMCAGDQLTPEQEQRALVQHHRLATMIDQQKATVRQLWQGLHEAAGLPLLPVESAYALPPGVWVQIPAEAEPTNFYWFAQGENTPVRWLPEVRPLHYAAVGMARATATNLARWLLVPVGPEENEETIRHAVLGIVKTAEYLGVRWRLDPARAVAYAHLLDEMYGPTHDAYRPVFGVADVPPEHLQTLREHFQATSCRTVAPQKEEAR